LPLAATPFADPETPAALLHPPSRATQTDYQIGFDTRQVDIQSYLKVDTALGIDSVNIWQTHYGELSDYLADMLAAGRKKAVERELAGQARQDDSAQAAANRYEIPVKIPEWAKRLGLSKPALTLTGSYTLQLKAASHWTSQEEAAGNANKIPDFSPEQIPNINLTGNIGKFVSMSLTWNQEGFGATQNQDLHIKYAGEKPEDTEDDILQEAEFGQIQLAMPGTALTGYTEAASGVLGVRAKMKFGDFDLTVMGGSQKGEQQKQHIGRGAKETVQPLVRDRDVDIGYDFFLSYQGRQAFKTAGLNVSNLLEPTLYVYQRVKPTDKVNHSDWITAIGSATIYDSNGVAEKTPNATTTLGETWRLLKEGVDYYWQNGVLRMTRSGAASTGQALGAAWSGYRPPGATSPNYGSGGNSATKVDLVLLYDDNDRGDPYLRLLQLRNRYYKLPTVSLSDQANIKLRILDNASTSGDPSMNGKEAWITTFKLADGSGKLNYQDPSIFDWAHNALIFPDLEPFSAYGEAAIYDTLKTALPLMPARFSIEITAKSTSDSIKIGSRDVASVSGTNCVDILPGSEVLTIAGGTRLEKGVDYDVQYQTGTITLLSARARDPAADISVDYACTPFFSLENRTVAGARLEYQLPEISKESVAGATFLYRSETTTDLRPQLGREGSSAMLWGANLRLTGESESLTDLTARIPLIKPKTESRWRLELEGAQSQVNPNPSGYALVDDFENSQLNNDLPINRTSWTQASPPGGVPSDGADYDATLNYEHQGQLIWSSNSTEKLSSIYPNHDDGTGAPATQSLLQLRFTPNDRSGSGYSWGGIMRVLSSSYTDLSTSKYLEVVVNANGGQLNFDFGDISEDLSIDGNAPDGKLEGENVNDSGAFLQVPNDLGLDGKANADEVAKVWTCYGPTCQSTVRTKSGNDDPAGDDFRADAISGDPDATINGTQGNNAVMGANYFDSENLDGSGGLKLLNAFDRFRIKLGGASASPYQTLQGGWRLYRIPLDKATLKKGGGATWNKIKYVRIWVDGLSTANGGDPVGERLQIARMTLVGNQWQGGGHLSKNDTTTVVDSTYSGNWSSVSKVVSLDSSLLDVSTIGRTTDNANYVQSPEVPQVRDATTGALQNEQSLRLVYKNLHRDFLVTSTRPFHADTGAALRTYDVGRDFTLYQNLELLVYHQATDGLAKAGTAPVRFGVQFGSGDPTSATAPYYEYSFDPVPADCPKGDLTPSCQDVSGDPAARMQKNWQDNEIRIPVKTLTSLKTLRDVAKKGLDTLFRQAYTAPLGSSRDDSIAIVGNPTVSQVTWMRMWVRPNPSSSSPIASGEIWEDDLRLDAPHKAMGSALRGAVQMNFSDLLDLSAATEYRGGDFVPMGQKEPALSQQQATASVTGTARLSLDKFLPESWKAQLPVSYTFTGGLTRPWSRPGSDQELTRDGLQQITADWWDGKMRRDSADIAVRNSRAYETMTVTRTLSASWSRGRDENPGLGAFLTNVLTSRPKASWTYTEQGTLAPENRDSTWTHTLRLDYDFSPSAPPNLKPFGSAKGKWVPDFVKNFAIQPWPTVISSTLGDLDYLEGTHAVLAPDQDSLPRSWTHTYSANLNHAISMDWPLFDFAKFNFSERSTRLWNDSLQTPNFDPSTGLIDAWPLIFDWDTTHVSLPSDPAHNSPLGDPYKTRQQFGLLRNEMGRTSTFSFDLTPRILPWFTTTGSYQANGSLNREASTLRQDLSSNDTVSIQYWNYSHSDNFRSTLRLDVPAVFRTLQGILPDSWSKSLNDARQGLDRWRWTGIGLEYSMDDRISGVRQTLDYTSYDEKMDAGSLQLWQMGLADAQGWRSPVDLVTGGRSKSGFGQYDPSRLNDLNYDPSTSDTSFSAVHSGQVNTRSYRLSTSTDVTVPGLLLTLQPSLTYLISWDERWATPWDVDTTVTWPQISVNATLANFAGRVPLLGRWFESVTASHTTTWEKQQQIFPHSISNNVDNYSWKWAPLLGLQAKTKGNWSFDDRTNFGVTQAVNFLKAPDDSTTSTPRGACSDPSLPIFYRSGTATVDRCFHVIGKSQDWHYDMGNEGTATYRFQTHKGIQFFRWFIKLDNDLVVTFKGGWTREWKLQSVFNPTSGTADSTQTLEDVTTVYGGSNASYNFTSKLVANFDASYKRTDRSIPGDLASTNVTNDISLLASLQYKF
jgi:hypothetical protein